MREAIIDHQFRTHLEQDLGAARLAAQAPSLGRHGPVDDAIWEDSYTGECECPDLCPRDHEND